MILYICAWVDQNSLLLNTLKCCYLLFSRKPTATLPSSPLLVNNTVLCMAKEFKYLGVTFSLDASWTPHINTICLKTRKLVGMLFQKFYCHTDSHSLLKLYLSTVHPHLEYASSVWDPYLKKNIDAIEHVQKLALKVCLNLIGHNVTYYLPLLSARDSRLLVSDYSDWHQVYSLSTQQSYNNIQQHQKSLNLAVQYQQLYQPPSWPPYKEKYGSKQEYCNLGRL